MSKIPVTQETEAEGSKAPATLANLVRACLKIKIFKRAAHGIQQQGICLIGKKPHLSIFCTTETNIQPTILLPTSTATKYIAQQAKV